MINRTLKAFSLSLMNLDELFKIDYLIRTERQFKKDSEHCCSAEISRICIYTGKMLFNR